MTLYFFIPPVPSSGSANIYPPSLLCTNHRLYSSLERTLSPSSITFHFHAHTHTAHSRVTLPNTTKRLTQSQHLTLLPCPHFLPNTLILLRLRLHTVNFDHWSTSRYRWLKCFYKLELSVQSFIKLHRNRVSFSPFLLS
jgi:hypothetical protein